MQTTIQKWGNSQGIRIPKAFLDAVGMKENDAVELNRVDNTIVVAKVNSTLTLDDIFKNYDDEGEPDKFDWGVPMGKELW